MTGNEKRPLMPRLRFPEFRKASDWNPGLLGELSEVVRGGSPRPIDGFLTTAADGLNWLKIGDVDKEAKYVTQTAEKVRPEALNKTRVVNPGALILSNSMSFGRPYILQIKTCIHDGWIAITNITKQADRDFLYYAISAPGSQNYFIDNAAGSGVQNLNADIIKNLPVCFPSTISEQQKIANCLSSIDGLITAEIQKLDTLKTHKQGLMRQFFPRVGERHPHRRFSSEGDWIVASLPEVVFFQEGPGIMAVDFHSEGVPLVRLAGVGRANVTLDGCNYLDPEKVSQKWAHFRLELDDLIISTSATFGLTSIVTEIAAGAVFYTGLIRLRPSNEKLTLNYLKAFLGSPHFGQQSASAAVGGGIKHFGPTHLKKMEIPIPPMAEQRGIADCLSSIDELVVAQSKKVELLKTQKKGLMQQLFPKFGEVRI